MRYAYITVEIAQICFEMLEIVNQIIDSFNNLDLHTKEINEYYFVLKIKYEEFEELQDLASSICFVLLGKEITRFTTTLNY